LHSSIRRHTLQETPAVNAIVRVILLNVIGFRWQMANFVNDVWFIFHYVLNWCDGLFDLFAVQTVSPLILFPERKN